MLVVVAFLIETAAADGEFALPRLRFQATDGGVLGIVTECLLDLTGVGHIRFALENTDLLFVGFSALHLHFVFPVFTGLCDGTGARNVLVDAASGVHVVLEVALDRVLAEGGLDVVGRYTGHGRRLLSDLAGSPDWSCSA